MDIIATGGGIMLSGVRGFDVAKTFDCGQCFRFESLPEPKHKAHVGGVAYGRYIELWQDKPSEIFISGADKEDFDKIWYSYLGCDVDWEYAKKRAVRDMGGGDIIRAAAKYGGGIRMLSQEHFETLVSFIISQNNNIPRIKKIIRRLCEEFGKPFVAWNGQKYFSFPCARALAAASEEKLMSLGTGFRARYIKSAADMCASGEIDLDKIPVGSEGAKELMKICGVGPKVAACTLLFSYRDMAAFPVDVHIKNAIDEYFGGKLDTENLGAYAGLAQQYLFYYEKYRLAQ